MVDGQNGIVAEPEPASLAAAFDKLHADRALAQRMGEAALQRIDDLGVSWDRVVERLLA